MGLTPNHAYGRKRLPELLARDHPVVIEIQLRRMAGCVLGNACEGRRGDERGGEGEMKGRREGEQALKRQERGVKAQIK